MSHRCPWQIRVGALVVECQHIYPSHEDSSEHSYESVDGWVIEWSIATSGAYRTDSVNTLLANAVTTDGADHKQHYLEVIAARLEIELPEHDAGVAP